MGFDYLTQLLIVMRRFFFQKGIEHDRRLILRYCIFSDTLHHAGCGMAPAGVEPEEGQLYLRALRAWIIQEKALGKGGVCEQHHRGRRAQIGRRNLRVL